MYYEEKVIDGVLHYRYSQNDPFMSHTEKNLTTMYLTAQSRLDKAKDLIRSLNSTIKEHTSWDLK